MERTLEMKRFILSVAGLLCLAGASGCCCDWCHPCGNSCSPYGAGYQAAPVGGAWLTPYAAPAVGAVAVPSSAVLPTYIGGPAPMAYLAPLESLPTY